jgi:hypothetical protein
MSWQSSTRYETAMYWPEDGSYGGAQTSHTEEQARATMEAYNTDSCVKSGEAQVHIRKVTIERVL